MRAPGAAPAGAPHADGGLALRRTNPRALRGRLLRLRAARPDAQDHRAAAHAVEADHPAFLSHARLRHRQAAGRARRRSTPPRPGKDGKPAYKISVNDFVIKALALALQRVPDANVTWTEAGMLHHHHSDIGVAVAIPGGLITPVVRNAESEIALDHFQRDEGSTPRAREPATSSRRNTRAARPRFPISACTASRISPR